MKNIIDISEIYLNFLKPNKADFNSQLEILKQKIYTFFQTDLYLILKLNTDNHENLKKFHFELFSYLFKIVEQNSNRSKIINVKFNNKTDQQNNYANSNVGFQFHTDGIYLPKPPEIIGLSCLQPATKGGESIVIDGNQLIVELKENNFFFDNISKMEFNIRSAKSFENINNVRKPILEFDKNNELFRINYFRGSITDKLSENEIKTLNFIDLCCFKLMNNINYKLEKGDLILINNYKTLHGRNHFVNDDQKRHFLRFWGDLK
jgi:alpha-ketoglutarate-dependent taurine dioxygenase